MRYPLVLAVALCCGCASAGKDPVAERRSEGTVVANNDANGVMSLGTSELKDVREEVLPAKLAAVWSVLPLVYDSLGIPVTMRDPNTGMVGNGGYDVRRLIGGTMVTRYFDCGEGRGGSSALSYDLFLTVLTHVTATPSGETKLSTSTVIRARPIANSGEWIRCETRGLLEQRIEAGVIARLTK